MTSRSNKFMLISFIATIVFIITGCSNREKITNLSQLDGKEFAVPTGTVADKLVLSKFPNAKFKYFNSVLDASMAVKAGKADAAAYDEPILKNIAAKNPGLKVLSEMITVDNYGFAVNLENSELKNSIDSVVAQLKSTGKYDELLTRWLPKAGSPGTLPQIQLTGKNGTLKFGTSAVTEPFAFIDGTQKVTGFDIEIAYYIAQKLDMQLEIINMDFGAMIPALISKKVDMIGACITITEERSKSVLFSVPYYTGGIAALIKE